MAALAVGTVLGAALVGGNLWLRSEHDASIRRERDRARREQALAARLDAIHLDRAILVEGRFNVAAERRFNNARADRNYESAFREAGFGAIGDNPAGVAARVTTSSERESLVAALDDWAVCADDERPSGVAPRRGTESRPRRLARPRPRSPQSRRTAPA